MAESRPKTVNHSPRIPRSLLLTDAADKFDLWQTHVAQMYGPSGQQIFDAVTGGGSYTQAEFNHLIGAVDTDVIDEISERYGVPQDRAVEIYQNGYLTAANSIQEIVETVLPQENVDAFQMRNEVVGVTRNPQDQLLRLLTAVDSQGDYEMDRLHYFAQFGMDLCALHIRNDFPGQQMRMIDHLNRFLFDVRRGESVTQKKVFNVIHDNDNNAALGVYDGKGTVQGNNQHLKKYYMAMRKVDGINCAVHPSLKSLNSALVKAHEKGGIDNIEDFVRFMLIVEGGKAERDHVMMLYQESLNRSDRYGMPRDDDHNDGRGKASGSVDWARVKTPEAGCEKPIEIAAMDHIAYFNYRNKISDGRDKAWRLFGFDRVVDVFKESFPAEYYNFEPDPVDRFLQINRNAIIADLRNSRVSNFAGAPEKEDLLDSVGREY